jgi:hypothetical protein
MKKRIIWTWAYFPFQMGGQVTRPMLTEVEAIEEKSIGKGYKGFSFKTPKGIKIAESITGAIVGDSFEQVRKDIAEGDDGVIKKQISEAKKELEKGNGKRLSKAEFFRTYKF